MKVKAAAAVAAVAVATTCGLTACSSGGGSGSGGGSSLPNTPANAAVCKVLQQVLAGTANLQLLAAEALANAKVSHELSQDLVQYAVSAADEGASAARHAQARAKQDCQSVTGS